MKLKKFLKAVDFYISDGSEYLWDCFGKNARFIDAYDDRDFSASAIYDTKTQRVYQIFVNAEFADKRYIWTDPEYLNQYLDECHVRGVEPYICYDDVFYEDNIKDPKELLKIISALVYEYKDKFNEHEHDEDVEDADNVEDIEDADNVEDIEDTDNVEDIEDADNVEDIEDADNVEDIEDADNVENVKNDKNAVDYMWYVQDTITYECPCPYKKGKLKKRMLD